MAADTIEERAASIVGEFSELEDWVDRYRHLVELGEAMPRAGGGLRLERHAIPGCEYDVWIRATPRRTRSSSRPTATRRSPGALPR